jgi:predicted porin
VQVFGTVYVEYAYANQGAAPGLAGDLVNIDIMQTPGSEIGFKGEEAVGGGTSAWFQCTSTAAPNGNGAFGAGGVWCGRNSALGLKGRWGNAYAGNWDMPFKKVAGTVRIVSDTGIWGAGPMLFGGSGSSNSRATPTVWSRRQAASIFYDTPVWNGFQVFTGVSTPSTSAEVGATGNLSGAKSRMWSLAASYTNGPLYIMGGYENHRNFLPGGGTYAGNDDAWEVGAAYTFGPVKLGALYSRQKYETTSTTNADVSVWNVAIDWKIQGPHELLVGYTKANDTRGTFGAVGGTQMGNRIYNAGAGNTGGKIWQVEYQYWLSKRTRVSGGYARVENDSNANYALGGLAIPRNGDNQDAFAVSIKHTF